MALWTDLVTPAELTGYSRAALADYEVNRPSLSAWLPNEFVQDIVARVTRGATGMVDAAEFRAYDAETPIGGAPGGSRVTFELPPLGKKERVGEYDQLRQRNADTPDLVINALEKVAARRVRSVADRVEVARGQVLTTGKVTISENGFTAEADFGRAGGNAFTVGTAWSTAASATVLADLQTAADLYRDANGEDPGAIVMSTRAVNYMMKAAELRNFQQTLAGTPNVVTRTTVNTILADYNLPGVTIYDRKVQIGGVATRVTPDDRVYLLPAPAATPDGTDLGATFWGTTLEAAFPEYQIGATDRPGIVVGAHREDDPAGVWVRANAIAMPALANPNLSVCMKIV